MIEIESWILRADGHKDQPFFIVRNTLNDKESFVPYDAEEESVFSFVTMALKAKPRKKHYAQLRKFANMELSVFIDWKPYGRYQSTVRIDK